MFTKPLSVALAGIASAALLTVSAPSATAQAAFPGAGFVVRGLTGMATTFTVPKPTCTRNENSIVVIGLMGLSIGTLAGWNAAAVVGCESGTPWTRMQIWVNAVGGGHTIATTRFGDVVQCRLIYATRQRPQLQVTNERSGTVIKRYLLAPATTGVAGAYSGGFVTAFPNVAMTTMANHGPISRLDRTRKVELRRSTVLIGSSYLNKDGYHHSLYWRHH